MSKRDSYANRRFNLMKQHPFCHWCSRELIYFKTEGGQKLPENFATIDHIYSRLMHPEGRPVRGKRILSCPKCNEDRGRREELTLGVEELRRRSRHNNRIVEPLEEGAAAFHAEVSSLSNYTISASMPVSRVSAQ